MLQRLTANLPSWYLDARASRRWTRIFVVLGVLALSGAVAGWGSQTRLLAILALLLGVAAVLLILQTPALGLVGLLAASMLIPFTVGTGTRTGVNITVLILPVLIGLWLLEALVRRRRILPPRSRSVYAAIALAGVAVLAFGVGQLSWFAFVEPASLRAQAGELAIFLFTSGAFLLAAYQIRSLDWLRRFTWVFLAIGGAFSLGLVVPAIGQITQPLMQPGATGSVLWFWITAMAISQVIFNDQLERRWKFLLGMIAGSVLLNFMFIETRWASGWIPSVVAIIVVVWLGRPRLGLALTVLAGVWIGANYQQVVDFVMVGDNPYSLDTRLDAWRIMGEIIRVNPILGVGPANYYWYTPLFSIRGYSVTFSSHNNYLDIMAQTGILGLGCFLWLLWELGHLGLRLRKSVQDGFSQAYVYGVLGGLAGTLVAAMLGDWVLPFIYNVGMGGFRASVIGWLFLGGLVALVGIVRGSNLADSGEAA